MPKQDNDRDALKQENGTVYLTCSDAGECQKERPSPLYDESQAPERLTQIAALVEKTLLLESWDNTKLGGFSMWALLAYIQSYGAIFATSQLGAITPGLLTGDSELLRHDNHNADRIKDQSGLVGAHLALAVINQHSGLPNWITDYQTAISTYLGKLVTSGDY